MEILLGCGSSRAKKFAYQGRSEWSGLVTLDLEARHKPDVLHDMNCLPLPFEDDSADEIHAYECLEHCGRQGDYRFFFDQWSDLWRILKPGGVFIGTVPRHDGIWAWGDPSHSRVIQSESLIFLSQPSYEQVGLSPMSDFRSIYKADFDLIHLDKGELSLTFALRAVKPSRIK